MSRVPRATVPYIWAYNGGLSGKSANDAGPTVLDKAKAMWERNGSRGTIDAGYRVGTEDFVWVCKDWS